MRRLVFLLAAFVLLLSSCYSDGYKDMFRVEMKDAVIIYEEEAFPRSIDVAWLHFTRRKSDGYWYIHFNIPNMAYIDLGPEHEYYSDGVNYLFQESDQYIRLGCGETPYIWASFTPGSRFEFTPDRKTAKKISKVLDECVNFPLGVIPDGDVAAPVEAVNPFAARPASPVAEVDEDEGWDADVEEEDGLTGNAAYPRYSPKAEDGDGDGSSLLVSGDFSETKFYRGVYDAGWTMPPSTYHIDIYEDELVRRFPDGSSRTIPFTSFNSDGDRCYSYNLGSNVYEYTYSPKDRSLIYGVTMDGQYYWCRMVPAGSAGSGSQMYQQGGSYGNQQQLQQNQRAQMYLSQYRTWENTVISNYNTLMTMRDGAARTSVRMNFRNAQSQMRQIRQNAQMEGISFTASVWENADVPLGYE